MERKTQRNALPRRSEELRGFAEALRKASPTSRRAYVLQGAKNRPLLVLAPFGERHCWTVRQLSQGARQVISERG
jgi:hypothetical protein